MLDRDPDADPPARAEALAGMAWAEAVAGDPAVVDELLAQADRMLDGGPAGDLLVHDIGVARGHALIRAGQFAASYGPLIAASAAAGRAGRPDMAYSCLSNAASAAACAGELDRALDFSDRCLALVVPNGLLRLSVYAETARAALLRRLGRLAEARGPATRPPATPSGPGCPSWTAWSGTSAGCSPWRPGTWRRPRPGWPPPWSWAPRSAVPRPGCGWPRRWPGRPRGPGRDRAARRRPRARRAR